MTASLRRIGGLIAVVVALTGCTTDDRDPDAPSPTSPTSSAPASTSAEAALGKAAEQQLARALGDSDDETRFSSGSGPLAPVFGNTLPDSPGIGSMTFVLACTGGATLEVSFADNGAEIPGARTRHSCGDKILRRSIPTTASSHIGFSATTQTTATGGYAFAYLPEKSTS
ncbi:hypothetical protein [Pilimelia columellifera]|uniref:Lipoprotein n=1 Tax=Pilimelia columellifera subsp. columellifera TaxID=706583 RepID=A0ABP6B273_9ACTN